MYLPMITTLLCLSCLLTTELFAREEKWTHYGLRPLGMGNAFVAVADDFNALFYNPAGLARLSDWDIELLNPMMELSANTRNFVSDIQKLQSGSAGNTESILDLIEHQAGKIHHVAVGGTPHIIIPGFGLAVGLELSGTMIFHRYPTVEVKFGPSITIPIAFAMNLLEDKLSIGAGLKARFRGGLDHEFSLDDINAFSNKSNDDAPGKDIDLKDYVNGGRGIGADVGLLFTPIKTMEPTIGLSVTDLGGTKYEKMNLSGTAIGTPATTTTSINAGFSLKPFQRNNRYFLVAVDLHSINQAYSFSKKLNLGSEFALGKLFKFQLGLHQGYLSGGMQFDVQYLKFRIVTYAEELGESAGSIQDRRFALQLKLLI